jgi:hypothetical protein
MSFGGDKKQSNATYTNQFWGEKMCQSHWISRKFFLQLLIFRQWVLPTGHQNIAGFLKVSTFLTETVTKFG